MPITNITCSNHPIQIQREVWRSIVGYESLYSISTYGRVRRDAPGWGVCRAGRMMQLHPNDRGYLRVHLTKDGTGKSLRVSKLLAQSFLDSVSGKPEVNHKNGIKADNYIDNLEYASRQDNMRHAYRVLGVVFSDKARRALNARPFAEKSASARRGIITRRKHQLSTSTEQT